MSYHFTWLAVVAVLCCAPVALGQMAERVFVAEAEAAPAPEPERTTPASVEVSMPEASVVSLRSLSLHEALEFVRETADTNMHVNWTALNELGISRETPVNLRVQELSLRQALSLLLHDTGMCEQLSFYIDGNVTYITTRELADQTSILRVYDIGDLLVEVPSFSTPRLLCGASRCGGGLSGVRVRMPTSGGTVSSTSRQSVQPANDSATDSGGRIGSVDGGGSAVVNVARRGGSRTRGERGEEFVRSVLRTVEPQIWRENGGHATIQFLPGQDQLVVSAPRSVHELLAGSYFDLHETGPDPTHGEH